MRMGRKSAPLCIVRVWALAAQGKADGGEAREGQNTIEASRNQQKQQQPEVIVVATPATFIV